jgi:hypothetical protein
VAADDLVREQECVRSASVNAPEAEKLRQEQQQPVEWLPDNLQGRSDVRGAGKIVSYLCCSNAHLYLQQLRDALRLATTADQKNGPRAHELLKTLIRLREEANSLFIAVQEWV